MSAIRRVVGIAALALGFAFVAPTPMALAEQDRDCSDFQYQEDAQAVFDADPSDPNRLDEDDDSVACESLPPRPVQQPTETTPPPAAPPVDTAADLDCGDFASREEAQAALDADPSDPNRLDGDDDGIACEAQVADKPSGGVDTGGLSGNPDSGSESGLLIALGGLTLAGATAVVVRRRATR